MKELLEELIAAKLEIVLNLLIIASVPRRPELFVGLVADETHEHLHGYNAIQLIHSRIYPCARVGSPPMRSAASIRWCFQLSARAAIPGGRGRRKLLD